MRKSNRSLAFTSIFLILLSYSAFGYGQNDDSFGLRLVSVDSECPFSQWTIRDLVKPLFTEAGFDPDADSITLNMFFNCKNIEDVYVFDSRIHIGLRLSTGPTVYYESPTFGGLYGLDETGVTKNEFLVITEETVVTALDYVKENWEEILNDRKEAN